MKPADAILVWLDVVPLNELASEAAVSTVKKYRDGQIVLSHAMTELWEHCAEEITEWAYFNFDLEHIDTILSNEESI
jgi:hypothetical protein